MRTYERNQHKHILVEHYCNCRRSVATNPVLWARGSAVTTGHSLYVPPRP